MAAVPPVPFADLHAVLGMCGITAEEMHARLITHEGFNTLEDLGILENDTDVMEMAKQLASCMVAEGCINLEMVQIKCIQALVWWVHDHLKHGQALDAVDWTHAAMGSAMKCKHTKKECSEMEASVKDLVKFDPDDFDIHEDAFVNLLVQTYGTQGEPIRYVMQADHALAEFVDEAEEWMYQLPLVSHRFEEDNCNVFQKLQAFLIDMAGWAWIEPFNTTEDGRGAFWAWSNHYNGQGELSKWMSLTKACIESLHYKNKQSMSFEKYVEYLMKAFTTLEKDQDESLSEWQKVEKLLKGINTSNGELQARKAVIMQNYLCNFAGACAYFSQQVSCIHGGAQLESHKYHKHHISEVNSSCGWGWGQGRGCGCFRCGDQ